MAKKRVEINPGCGKRLQELIIKSGMKNKQVADLVSCDAQHISNIIHSKRRLTPEFAALIVEKAFPDIRIEYLLCMDDDKTEADHAKKLKEQELSRLSNPLFHDAVARLYLQSIGILAGYNLESVEDNTPAGMHIQVLNVEDDIMGTLPLESVENLRDEIRHYATYQLDRLMREELEPKGDNEKEDD